MQSSSNITKYSTKNIDEKVFNDTYTLTSPSHRSVVFALGCFWCAEEAFENYAPGVIEAVSGYIGGISTYPSYQNHVGHHEAILVEYDPSKTSYEILVQYAWRNIDPYDIDGQFCDRGESYSPAFFYQDNDEQRDAIRIFQQDILNDLPNLQQVKQTETDHSTVGQIPLLERSTFWKAEAYHQNYHIKNSSRYRHYNHECGREKRLKEIWGEETYDCYHNLSSSCYKTILNNSGTSFNTTISNTNSNSTVPIKTMLLVILFIVLGTVIFYTNLICFFKRRK